MRSTPPERRDARDRPRVVHSVGASPPARRAWCGTCGCGTARRSCPTRSWRVEERAAVGDAGCRRRRPAIGQQQRRAARPAAEHEVDDALEPAVAAAVQLADVEQQRHPLELGHREHAQPLLVEQRQRAHPRARLVQRRPPGPRPAPRPAPRGRARSPTTCSRRDQLDERLVAGAGRLDLGHRRRPPTSRAGRSALRAISWRSSVGAGRVADHQHAVAPGRRAPAVGGERGADQVPGHQQDGRAEHHEAGQQRVAHHAAARSRCRARRHGGRGHRGDERPGGRCGAGRAGRGRRRPGTAARCRRAPRRSGSSRGRRRAGWRCSGRGSCSGRAPRRRCRGRARGRAARRTAQPASSSGARKRPV